MFVCDKLVYLQLQKTACTHIARLLDRTVGGSPGTPRTKHFRLPPELRGSFVVGSVRNPYEWYVSLWAHGCKGGGTPHGMHTSRYHFRHRFRYWWALPTMRPRDLLRGLAHELFLTPVTEWRKLYADAYDPRLFRRWLKMVLDPNRRYDIGESYGESCVWPCAGFFTYRYLRLFSNDISWLYQSRKITDKEALKEYDAKYNQLDRVIRVEHLDKDLLDTLRCAGYDVTESIVREVVNASKTNASDHSPAQSYYDTETARLVAEREALIIDKYQYEAPNG